MIERYTRPEMGAIWSEENKYQKWLDVEIAVCEAWNKLGKIPSKALQEIKKKAAFSLQKIEEVEKVVKHDVIAFLTSVAEHVGENARYIHLGLTSYDIVDTALSLLIKESLEKIDKDLFSLQRVLRKEAIRHKKTIMVGRTHGVHAEPITFGVKLLVWYEEIKRHVHRITQAKEVISCGRISGAVGTYNTIDPRVETHALMKLKLRPARVTTQILQRDRHAEILCCLALIASSLDKFAVEIRHLQRTEVLELEEPFTKGQKGSSSMPHKKNPVRSERISGIARLVRANVQASLENIPLWHERDISHSSTERVLFPDSFILTDFMLAEFTDIIKNWSIFPQRMKKNIDLTQGQIFSQKLLIALMNKNLSRDQAYRWVQKNSLKAWEQRRNFQDIVRSDPQIKKTLTAQEIEECFSLDPYMKNIEYIFKRVLTDES